MSLRAYLIIMTIGALICWLAWFFVVGSIDPSEAGMIGFIFFYASLFLALTGSFATIGFWIRKRMIKNDDAVFHHVKHTFRQGIIISSTLIIALMLLQAKLLAWWNAILLLLLFFILESVIFTSRKYNNRDLAP